MSWGVVLVQMGFKALRDRMWSPGDLLSCDQRGTQVGETGRARGRGATGGGGLGVTEGGRRAGLEAGQCFRPPDVGPAAGGCWTLEPTLPSLVTWISAQCACPHQWKMPQLGPPCTECSAPLSRTTREALFQFLVLQDFSVK